MWRERSAAAYRLLIRGFCSIAVCGEKGLQQLTECSSGVLFNQFLHTGDVFRCPRLHGPTGADSLLHGESATLDLTAPTLDGSEYRAGLREGDGVVLMDLGDGFPKFVAN